MWIKLKWIKAYLKYTRLFVLQRVPTAATTPAGSLCKYNERLALPTAALLNLLQMIQYLGYSMYLICFLYFSTLWHDQKKCRDGSGNRI